MNTLNIDNTQSDMATNIHFSTNIIGKKIAADKSPYLYLAIKHPVGLKKIDVSVIVLLNPFC